MKRLNWFAIVGGLLALAGVVVGAFGMFRQDPFLGLFGVTIVLSGGVFAMLQGNP